MKSKITLAKSVLGALGTPPLPNTAKVVLKTVALTGLAFSWGFAKGRINRRSVPKHARRQLPVKPMDVFGAALEEEVMYRAGVNRVIGPVSGAVLFGLGHFSNDPKESALGKVFRVADAAMGGALYEHVYTTALGEAPTGLAMIGAILRGLAASTAAHTAHNIGVRVGLSGKSR